MDAEQNVEMGMLGRSPGVYVSKPLNSVSSSCLAVVFSLLLIAWPLLRLWHCLLHAEPLVSPRVRDVVADFEARSAAAGQQTAPPPPPGPLRSTADMGAVTLEDGVAKQAAMRVSKDLAGVDIAARVTAAHLDELAGQQLAAPSKNRPSSSRRGTRTTADRPAGSAGGVAPDQTLPGVSRRGTRTTSDRPAGGMRASSDQLVPLDEAAADRLAAAARLSLVEEDVQQLERVAAFAAGERQPAPVVVSAASRMAASVPGAPALGQAEVLQDGSGSAAGRVPGDAPAAWPTAQAQQQQLAAQLEAMSQLHTGGLPASAVQLGAVPQPQQQQVQPQAMGQLSAGTLQEVGMQQGGAGVTSFPVRQQTSEASRDNEGHI